MGACLVCFENSKEASVAERAEGAQGDIGEDEVKR